ncbi:hypothetical protein FHS20_001309 [Phyllobacterium endophyticum]|nr:hypothetical protein [Phyllobacterium endophyticum]
MVGDFPQSLEGRVSELAVMCAERNFGNESWFREDECFAFDWCLLAASNRLAIEPRTLIEGS